MQDDGADQNAPTRTVAPAEPDAHRTRSSDDGHTDAEAGVAGPADTAPRNRGPGHPRLPAPLQYRDPDRYEVIAEHGRGGLGRVLRAKDRELGRSVAIKELLEPTKTSELRFFREALITARLEHPGIVPVHEAGRWPDGTPFYAMKLVAGRPLKELIDEAKTLEERLALIPHVIAVADAVAYAHSKGIIHRDLKPANVIVGEFGETIVIDWGLARDVDQPDREETVATTETPHSVSVTVDGTILGTPAYMAPEQRRGVATKRTDIYAIGGLLYTVLSQRAPAGSDTYAATALGVKAPRDLAAIIQRAMSAEPLGRYQSAADIAADLRRFLQRRPVTARSYSVLSRIALTFSRNRTLASVAAIFLTLLLGLSFFAAFVTKQQERETAVAEAHAQEARTRAETKVGELTLANARLLLNTDPTRALTSLEAYTGNAGMDAEFLRAEAIGRGVAQKILNPHGDTVTLLAFTPNGALLSSGDTTISTTSLRTWQTSSITAGITPMAFPAHSERGDVIAYVQAPSTLVIRHLDKPEQDEIVLPETPKKIVLSADASMTAVYLRDSTIALWGQHDDRLRTIGKAEGLIELTLLKDADVFAATSSHLLIFRGQRAIGSIELTGHVTSSHVNTSSGRFVAGFADGTVRVWTLPDLRMEWSSRVCVQSVDAVVVATAAGFACRDRVAGALVPGNPQPTIMQLESPVRTLAMDASGAHFIAGTESGAVHVAHLFSGFQRTLRGHASPITKIATETRAHYLLLASADAKGEIRLWDLKAAPARLLTRVNGAPYGINFSRSGEYLISGSRSGTVYLWHFPSGKGRTLIGHKTFVYRVLLSPDDRIAVSADFDGLLIAWNVASGEQIASVQSHRAAVLDMALLPDGATVVAAGHDGRLIQWTPGTGDVDLLYQADQPLRGVRVLEGNCLVVSHSDGSLAVLDEQRASVSVPDSLGFATSMLLRAPSNTYVAMGNSKGEVRFYWPSTGRVRFVTQVEEGIRHLAFSSDERYLAIASEGASLRVLSLIPNVATTISLEDAPTRHLSFLGGSPTVVTLSNSGMVRLLDLGAKQWTTHELHTGYINGGAFSPSSKEYISAGADGRIVSLSVSAALSHRQSNPPAELLKHTEER